MKVQVLMVFGTILNELIQFTTATSWLHTVTSLCSRQCVLGASCLCCLSLWHLVKQLLVWIFLHIRGCQENTLHVLPWILSPCYHLLEKLHLSSAPSPVGRHSSTQTCFPPRCLSILALLIKPHGFLFIKIMPRKPWIQQNAKEQGRQALKGYAK